MQTEKESVIMAEAISRGDRSALARAITLVESRRPEDKSAATTLLANLHKSTQQSLRIGITGPPGVGKSSLLEVLGLHIISKGYKLAILSVDPSSAISKGSILGDKTRMNELARESSAFIRPSPTGEHLGGVARRTRESIWLCESASYDFIFVETAGIGQTEYQVSTMTDLTILLTLSGAGDDLQGIKKGIMEWADIIVLNKVDQADDPKALSSYRDLMVASHFIQSRIPNWKRPILKISAIHKIGINELFNEILAFREKMYENDWIFANRKGQLINYYRDLIKFKLWDEIILNQMVANHITETEKKLIRLELTPEAAADISLDFIFALFK